MESYRHTAEIRPKKPSCARSSGSETAVPDAKPHRYSVSPASPSPHGRSSPEAQAPHPVVAQKVPASIRIPLSIREIIQFAIAQEMQSAPDFPALAALSLLYRKTAEMSISIPRKLPGTRKTGISPSFSDIFSGNMYSFFRFCERPPSRKKGSPEGLPESLKTGMHRTRL